MPITASPPAPVPTASAPSNRFAIGASARTRRRPRLDPRLVIGLLLVAAATAGTVGVVGATEHTVPVYAAAVALTPGERVHASQLVERDVSLNGADSLYLRVGHLPASGIVVTRAVGRGELVPASSVGSRASDGDTSLVVKLGSQVSSAVVAGALVDVWGASAPVANGGSGITTPPAVLVPKATVVKVLTDDGVIAGSDGVSVELLVPRSRVARLLQAIADGESLAVVPSGLALGAGG